MLVSFFEGCQFLLFSLCFQLLAGESVEKCRSTIAILENMEAVHAFSDMPLVLMKERKANGKFALYRLEHLPPRKVQVVIMHLDTHSFLSVSVHKADLRFCVTPLKHTSCIGLPVAVVRAHSTAITAK